MYGLVNKGLKDFVISGYGHKEWDEIRVKAGVKIETFVGIDAYADSITYDLVAAASEILILTQEQVLERFGEYWILHTANEGYGEFMKLFGTNLKEFLQNLNILHARIRLSFPELRPPKFTCTDVSDHSLVFDYYSERDGLAPMVLGLLKGLGKKFNTPIKIQVLESRAKGADHDKFLVEF